MTVTERDAQSVPDPEDAAAVAGIISTPELDDEQFVFVVTHPEMLNPLYLLAAGASLQAEFDSCPELHPGIHLDDALTVVERREVPPSLKRRLKGDSATA